MANNRPDPDIVEFAIKNIMKIETLLANLPDKQQFFNDDKQVIRRTEIKVGELYERVHTHANVIDRIKALSEPYQTDDGSWKLDIEYISGDTVVSQHLYLSDCGIVPYNNGKWHNTNYLRRVE